MQLYSNILGQGQPFVILHGFLGMSDNWKTLGVKFSEAGYQVHLVDQRNHGRSFHDNAFSYEVLAEDLKGYFEAHQLKDAIVLGHSMGGKTAMLFASQFPELVSKLIVADISPRFYPIHHDAILEGLCSLDFSKIKTRGEANQQLAHYISNVGIRQFLLKNLYWKEKGQLDFRFNLKSLTENNPTVGEALPNGTVFNGKTLFLKGGNSNYITQREELIIKTHFPNSEIKEIANVGHWLHAEKPQEFLEIVLDFFKK